MKIPKKVKICSHEFKVVFKRNLCDENGQQLLGLCDVNNCIIYLSYGMEPQKRFEVLFHEMMHAVDENLGFKLGEQKVNNLTIEILRLIKDNNIKIYK